MKKQSSLLVLAVAFAAMVGCSKSESEAPKGTIQTYFVKGDPDELIAGTQRVIKNTLTDANFTMWNDYEILNLIQFVEKEPRVKDADSYKTSVGANGKPVLDVSVSKIRNGHWEMALLAGGLKIDFKADAYGSLQPVHIFNEDGSKQAPIEILHWSRSQERGYVSFLFRVHDEKEGKQIIALYFQPKAYGVVIPKADSKYKFLAGAGERVGWKTAPGTLTVSLCGRGSASMAANAVDKWSKVLGSRLPLRFERPSTYYPFSDLNQHCYYIIDSYISETNKELANYGIAYTPFSRKQSEIFDSDIFIFESEFRKHGVPSDDFRLRDKWEITMVHELGHFLGLDHQFDGTRSVMSYAFDSLSPQRYDIEAIQALYAPEDIRVAQRKR